MTRKCAAESPGFAPVGIGLALTLIHPISVPVTNTPLNLAWSTGVVVLAVLRKEDVCCT